MLLNTLTVSAFFIALALATAEPAPYKLEKIGSMSYNNVFGRQAGYDPTQIYCGPGTDCASSCGAGYIQCASSDSDMHCFNPTGLKETCCPDGSGNSCSDGYFCTSDSTGGTWCCPDGMSLAACAAAYSLTGVLVSQTAAPTIVVPSSSPVSATAFTTSTTTSVSVSTSTSILATSSSSISELPASSLTTTSTYSVTTTAVKASSTSPSSSSSNLFSFSAESGTTTTTGALVQFTGGAIHVAQAGMPVVAFAVGALLAL